MELIVVDNASTDGSPELVKKLRGSTQVHQNGKNEGFSRAHNQAIRLSSGEFYLALNPDVIMDACYLESLVSTLQVSERRGSAGGKLRQFGAAEAPKIDSAGLLLRRTRRQVLRGRGEIDRGQFDRQEQVFGIDGAAPLYRRAMLEDIQESGEYFDETFFAYKEDVDLAWRARLLGWESWYDPRATAWHARSFRPGTRRPGDSATRRYSVRNRYLAIIKNDSAAGIWRDWPAILIYDLGILLSTCIRAELIAGLR